MDVRTVESIIEKVDGVRAVKVVGDGERIKEIHVVTDSSKNPKQIVRDIETAVFALTGLKIDRKVVSIAQIEGGGRRKKLVLTSFDTEEDGLIFRVKVSVSLDGDEYSAEVEGPRVSKRMRTLIGEAILKALSLEGYAISINDVSFSILNDEYYFLSHLSVFDGVNEWDIVGVSPSTGDEYRSIALSVLDALEKLL